MAVVEVARQADATASVLCNLAGAMWSVSMHRELMTSTISLDISNPVMVVGVGFCCLMTTSQATWVSST
jgi:hypothetical protein